MKPRYKQIDYLRGIAIILVILGHAIIVYPVNLHEIGWCSFLFSWLTTVHMPLFFLISGFCYNFEQTQSDFQFQYRKFIWKKVKRLLVPYFLFSGVSVGMKLMFPSVVNNKTILSKDIVDIVLYSGGYWFLYTLFIIFLFFPFLEVIYKRSTKLFAIINLSFLVMWLCNILLAENEIFSLNNICHYLPYFSLGFMVRKNEDRLKADSVKIKRPAYIVFALTLWIVCIFAMESQLLGFRFFSFVASLLGICCLTYLATVIHEAKYKILRDLSRYSLQLYIMNGYMLVISRTFAVKIMNWTNASVIIAFNMLIDLFLSLLIIKYVLAKNKFTRFLFGIM